MNALIVDDSRVLRMHMRTMLQGLGWDCTEAASASYALEMLHTGPSIELVLMDVNMPGMSGIECVRALRKKLPHDPFKVMMVTTEADFPLISEALDSGANEFLMKPFTREGLMAKLLLLGFGVEASV